MRRGVIAASRRRGGAGPAVSDPLDTLSGPMSVNATGSATIVGGRTRIVPTNAFPQRATADVLDFNVYPRAWIEVTAIPNQGNGTNKVRFLITDSTFSNQLYFQIEYTSAWIIFMHGTGTITNVSGSNTINPYNAATHRWLRYNLNGANLEFQTSPDGLTWTTRRTIVAPAWLLAAPRRAIAQTYFTGTEPSPGYAEFANFNVTPG